MQLCLTLLIGLPGSGKTTFAHTLKNNFKYFNDRCFNFIHVCYDELIPSANIDESESNWKDMRMDILNQVDSLLSSLKTNNFDNCPTYFKEQIDISLNPVIVIIIDDNMYLKSMRYAFFKKAKQHNISFCQVYLKCSVEKAVERNFSRSSKDLVPLKVITEMSKKIEEPRKDNKWEKYSLIADSENGTLHVNYFNLLHDSLKNPEISESDNETLNKEKSINICMTNVLHQCDIVLRQIISVKIQEFIKTNSGSRSALKKYSYELSFKKSEILNNIRCGLICLPESILNEIRQCNVIEKRFLKIFIQNLLDS